MREKPSILHPYLAPSCPRPSPPLAGTMAIFPYLRVFLPPHYWCLGLHHFLLWGLSCTMWDVELNPWPNPLDVSGNPPSSHKLSQPKMSLLTANSLQSCPTLCDPIDASPPGSPVPGILQARTLEWVAISFSNAWKWKVKAKSLSCDPMDCSPPGSSIHGIFQARVLEWGAIAFSNIGKCPLGVGNKPQLMPLKKWQIDSRYGSDRVLEELWTEVCDIVQEAVIKTIPKKKKFKKQNGCLRRAYK